jgi:phosphonate transport system ATP-binding protein
MLKFNNLEVTFPGGVRAVAGVSLEVKQGEFCVVLGSSGAGKSTLLRTVNGLVTPSAGEVIFDGTPVTPSTLRAVRKRIGMIHQQFNLVNRLTVHRNVLSGALHEVNFPRAALNLFPGDMRRKVCHLLAEVGMAEEQLYRRAGRLSGGQQQRVAIARAFILEPAVVLADEPVASLDPTTSATVLALLRQAARRHNTTVMCSLHQVAFAREFADRIVGMKNGCVVFDGPPGALTDRVLQTVYGGEFDSTTMVESDRIRGAREGDLELAGASA